MAKNPRIFYETHFISVSRDREETYDSCQHIDYLVSHPIFNTKQAKECDLKRWTPTSSISSLKTAYSTEDVSQIAEERLQHKLVEADVHNQVRVKPNLHLTLPVRVRKIHKFCDVLSPISDKSQEMSEAETQNNSAKVSATKLTKLRPVSLFANALEKQTLHGSDSGISLETNSCVSHETITSCTETSTNDTNEVLPFLMPKLRRNKIFASNTMASLSSGPQTDRQLSLNFNLTTISRTLNFSYEVDETLPLENQSWYHGCITRRDAQKMLTTKREGYFLVRDSQCKHNEYFFAIRGYSGVLHLQIFSVEKEDSSYFIQFGIPTLNGILFDSVPLLVSYCMKKGITTRDGVVIFPCLPLEDNLV